MRSERTPFVRITCPTSAQASIGLPEAMTPRIVVPYLDRNGESVAQVQASFGHHAVRAANNPDKPRASGLSIKPFQTPPRSVAPYSLAANVKALAQRNACMQTFFKQLGIHGEVHRSWPALMAACSVLAEQFGAGEAGTGRSTIAHGDAEQTAQRHAEQLIQAFDTVLDVQGMNPMERLRHFESVMSLLASPDTMMLRSSGNRQSCEVFADMASAVEMLSLHAAHELERQLGIMQASLHVWAVPSLQRILYSLHWLSSQPDLRTCCITEKLPLHSSAFKRCADAVTAQIDRLESW